MAIGYPIRAAARLAGLPLETLRAWERRYAVVAPGRDARGRLYSEEDVHKLRLLKQLVDGGYAIGRVAHLAAAELEALARELGAPTASASSGEGRIDLDALMLALDGYDAAGVERELGRLLTSLRPRDFVYLVALPLMRKVGDAWSEGRFSVAHEHLASAALRNALGTLVRLCLPEAPRGRVVLATAPGEQHEFGALAAAMIAATAGLGPLYLGPNLPAADVIAAARRLDARIVTLGLTGASDPEPGLAAIEALATGLPRGTELWVGGPRDCALAERVESAGARVIESLEEFERRLA